MIPKMPQNIEELLNDWKYNLFTEVVEQTHNYDEGMLIPLLTTLADENTGDENYPELSSLLDFSEEDLPTFYIYNSKTGQSLVYPSFLLDMKPTPEMIVLWAITSTLQMDSDIGMHIISNIGETEYTQQLSDD